MPEKYKGHIHDWYQVGENAELSVAMVVHGQRNIAIGSLATASGVTADRVRKSLSAKIFVDALGDSRLAEGLKAQPLTIVDVLRRWSSHDRDTAIRRAREVIGGSWLYRDLIAAEAKARRASGKSPAVLSGRWEALIKAHLLAGPAKGFDDAPPGRAPAVLPVSLWLQKGDRLVGVQILGPYPTIVEYGRNLPHRVACALAILYVRAESWIVMPRGTAGGRLREMLARLGVQKDVRLIELDLPEYATLSRLKPPVPKNSPRR
jgi:hypothetical protein